MFTDEFDAFHFFLCFEYISCELQYIGNELKQQSVIRSNIKENVSDLGLCKPLKVRQW